MNIFNVGFFKCECLITCDRSSDNYRVFKYNTQNRKIFVGGLDVDTKSEDLSDYFSQWGEIVDAVVMVDSATKRSRGFGFVTFQDHRSVDDCLQPSVKPHNISGKEV